MKQILTRQQWSTGYKIEIEGDGGEEKEFFIKVRSIYLEKYTLPIINLSRRIRFLIASERTRWLGASSNAKPH